MLVAPVKIGAGANTGAGSTIHQGRAEGKLTLARCQAGHDRKAGNARKRRSS
jgi:bifunctional N-acetylglucosamine-1-phosphate-uridyltransferase/glucosamine-1-phosphate-acetyltransferase GlmU-like protein